MGTHYCRVGKVFPSIESEVVENDNLEIASKSMENSNSSDTEEVLG